MILRIFLLCGVLTSCAESSAQPPGDESAGLPAWSTQVTAPTLDASLPLKELQAYAAPRIPKLLPPQSLAEWESQANTIRTCMLDNTSSK